MRVEQVQRRLGALALLSVLTLLVLSSGAAAASPSNPIRIVGDDALLAAGWPGEGTFADPIVISNVKIIPASSSGSSAGIYLESTTLHVVIRDVEVEFGGTTLAGIQLKNTRNVTIADSTLVSNGAGILLQNTAGTNVTRVTVRTSQVGLSLQSSSGNTFTENRVQLNKENVRLSVSPNNTFTKNNLSISAAQTGWFFADNVSYENAIDSTNVVNGMPMKWYVRPTGTSTTPVVIDRPNVTLKGITNIAQVMVYQGRDVEVQGPSTSEGTAAGLLVFGGERIHVIDAFAERNAGPGILADQVNAFSLSAAKTRENDIGISLRSTPLCAVDVVNASNNRGAGLGLVHAPSCTLTGSVARENAGAGMALTASPGASIVGGDFAQNQGGGILVDTSQRVNLTNASFTNNGGTGLRITSAQDARITESNFIGNTAAGIHILNDARGALISNNTLSGHPVAIRFSSANSSTLRDNTITINGATALHFDDETSYDTTIETSNLVNGAPLHWYTNVLATREAPLVLSDLSASARGVTNVAQILIYKSENVTLERPTARNGAAAGIRIFESSNITIDGGVAADNTGVGIHVNGGRADRIQSTSARNNGGAGINLDRDGRDHALENIRAENNAGDGVAFRTVDGLDVRESTFTVNKGRGIGGESSSGITLVNNKADNNGVDGFALVRGGGAILNNEATRNAGAGYSLNQVAIGTSLQSNRALENAQGVRLRASTGLDIKANVITLRAAATGFHFDDTTSYQNLVDTTNVVNGTAMRWYYDVHGNNATDPLVIPGVDVSTPGMTNVAQVFVFSSSYIVFDSPAVRAGTLAGIHVLDSTNITVARPLIDSNGANGVTVTGGSGIRVENGTVQGNAGHGISLSSRNPLVSGTRVANNTLTGISVLSGTASPRIDSVMLTNNKGGGIVIKGTSNAVVVANQLTSNGLVGLDTSQNTFLRANGNMLENHLHSVRISAQTGAWFDGNRITLSDGQFGFFVDAETSYLNHFNESNLVDGTPVRWYTGDQGGRTISSAVVGIPRITNVAQFLVYGATNLTIDKAVVANGTAHGLLIKKSTNVTIQGGSFLGNSGDGIRIDREGAGVVVHDVVSTANGASGVAVASAMNVNLSKNIVSRNQQHGISLEENADRTLVTTNFVQSNTLDGIRLDRTYLGLVTTNEVYDNGRAGIALTSTKLPAQVNENVIGNNPVGVRLTSTLNTRFDSNAITMKSGQTGFHFDDTASYDNRIDTSNRVNGVAVRWYTQLAGTVDEPRGLSGFVVELPGITNVAQVMLYRASYVVLDGVTASNGTGHGIYLYASSSVDVKNSQASNNLNGVSLYATVTSVIEGNVISDNDAGVHLTQSRDVRVANNNATGSTIGVRVADTTSSNNRVFGTLATGTKTPVIDASFVSGKPNRGNNLVVDAGLDKVGRVNVSVAFNDAMGVAREQRDTILSQTWRFGDGTTAVAEHGAAFRVDHTYALPGIFVATYEIETLAGETYSDTLLVEVIPNLSEPRALVAEARDAKVALNWSAPRYDSGVPVDRYRVYRATDEGPLALIDELRAVTNYTDVSVEGGHAYRYQVSAVNAEKESARSDAATVFVRDVPTAPTRLTAVELDGSTNFTWVAAEGRGALVEGYRVYAVGVDGTPALRYETDNVTFHEVPNLAHGDARPQYLVTAFNSEGESLASTPATLRVALRPDSPERFEARGGDGHVKLAWRAPAFSGSAPITGYAIYRADVAAEGTFIRLGEIVSLAFNDTTVENGVTYAYRVGAINEVGEGPSTTTLNVRPSVDDKDAPTFGARTPGNDSTVTGRVTVSMNYDDPSGIALNSVVLLLDGVDVTPRAKVNVSGLVYDAGALSPGAYRVVVRVEDAAGNFAREVWTFDVATSTEQESGEASVRAQSGNATIENTVSDGANETAQLPVPSPALPAPPEPSSSEANDSRLTDNAAPSMTFAQKLGIPGPGAVFALVAFVVVALTRKRSAK